MAEQKSNAGTVAAVLGGLGALVGIAAVVAGSKGQPKLRGPRPQFKRKPCNCGR